MYFPHKIVLEFQREKCSSRLLC